VHDAPNNDAFFGLLEKHQIASVHSHAGRIRNVWSGREVFWVNGDATAQIKQLIDEGYRAVSVVGGDVVADFLQVRLRLAR
jgi:hypothetical protein